mmetsp:Transcript_86506/g.231091  ORF Transcript_86506/g.231091 Transcript_86506/m.231091 type:complete len:225 (-) Transcript_86506:104-778(-)
MSHPKGLNPFTRCARYRAGHDRLAGCTSSSAGHSRELLGIRRYTRAPGLSINDRASVPSRSRSAKPPPSVLIPIIAKKTTASSNMKSTLDTDPTMDNRPNSNRLRSGNRRNSLPSRKSRPSRNIRKLITLIPPPDKQASISDSVSSHLMPSISPGYSVAANTATSASRAPIPVDSTLRGPSATIFTTSSHMKNVFRNKLKMSTAADHKRYSFALPHHRPGTESG